MKEDPASVPTASASPTRGATASASRSPAPGGTAPSAAVARTTAAAAVLMTMAAGLGVRSVAGGDLAKYTGDALYTVLIHAVVVLLVPRIGPRTAAAAALAFSWAVELVQLTGVPAELSRHSAMARLVLGSTFNAPDLVWYGVGAGLAWAVHALLTALLTARRAHAR